MSTGSELIVLIGSRQNLDAYQKTHWTGSFSESLDILQRDPRVTRTAYQRIYDMIIRNFAVVQGLVLSKSLR
jgi:serine protein kinase